MPRDQNVFASAQDVPPVEAVETMLWALGTARIELPEAMAVLAQWVVITVPDMLSGVVESILAPSLSDVGICNTLWAFAIIGRAEWRPVLDVLTPLLLHTERLAKFPQLGLQNVRWVYEAGSFLFENDPITGIAGATPEEQCVLKRLDAIMRSS